MAKGRVYDDGFSELPVTPASAGIGHNKPPTTFPIGPELDQRLERAHHQHIERADELLEKTSKFTRVETVKALKLSTEYVRQIQSSLTVLEAQRKSENEPYRVGKAQVDGFFGDAIDELTKAKGVVEASMNAFNRKVREAERKRLAEEAAAKRAREEAARKKAAKAAADAAAAKARSEAAKRPAASTVENAAVLEVRHQHALDELHAARADTTNAERALSRPAADITRQRSSNAVQSQQEYVDFRNLDRATIDLDSLRAHLGIDAIETAVRAYIRANNDALKDDLKHRRQRLRGVEFFMNDRTRVGG
jgi:hypothetical protein